MLCDYSSCSSFFVALFLIILEHFLKGYDEQSGSQNKLLESFIKKMNKQPLELVDEFLTKDKQSTQWDKFVKKI